MKLPLTDTKQINHEEAGKSVRKFRTKKRVSLRSVASELQLSAPYVSDLERGRRNWTAELFKNAEQAIIKLSC